MSIHYADDQVTLHVGCDLDVLRTLPDASVNCVVTSPPYFGLRDYGVDGQRGLEASPAEYVAGLVEVFAEVRRVLADDGTCWLNLGDSYSGSWGNQGRKDERGTQRPINGDMIQPVHDGRYPSNGSNTGAIKPGAPPAKNLLGIPWRVAFALQADGWYLRNAIIWYKPNAMPESVTDRMATRYELVFLLTKARRYWFDLDAVREPHASLGRSPGKGDPRIATGPQSRNGHSQWDRTPEERQATAHHSLGRNPGDVWELATVPFPGAHFAVMPLALAERCIQAGCKPGGVVLDPYSGSGTTGHAATRHGRRYVGIDLSADYHDLALRTRLQQGALIPDAEVAP